MNNVNEKFTNQVTSNGMKLLIITQKVNSNDPILGFFVSWIKKFAEQFEEVIAVAKEVGTYDLPQNVRVISLGKDKGVGRFRQLLKLWRVMVSEKYDRVFVHMNPENVLAGALYWKFIKNIPVALWYTHKATPWQLRLAIPWVKWIFTASKESFRLSSKKIIVTGHGIDLDHFNFIRRLSKPFHDPIRVLSVGRISLTKDFETIIKAINELRKENINIVLDIVGGPVMPEDFAYERALHELSDKLGFVTFLGPKSYNELPKIYDEHDIFLHASKTGSVDKVVLEAFVSGLFVLTSSEAFVHLLAGYRFEENNIADLVKKIKNILNKDLNAELYHDLLVGREKDLQSLDALIKKISNYLKAKS